MTVLIIVILVIAAVVFFTTTKTGKRLKMRASGRQMEQKPTIILLFGRRKILTPKQTLYIPRSRVKSRIMKHN